MRVFVAWDFADPRAKAVLEGVEAFGTGAGPDGRELTWIIPGLRKREESGPIGSALVARNIREADMVVALVDRANANVGWEIGLALGWGKQVRLGAVSETPAFRLGALAGQLVSRVENWRDVLHLVTQVDWTFAVMRPKGTSGAVRVLCPGGPQGAGLREALVRSRIDGIELVEPLTEKLDRVPALLAGTGQLIWVVTLPAADNVRDGNENASNAIVAGIAHAAGWKVTVMQSLVARHLVDVAADSFEFNTLDDFAARIRILAGAPLSPKTETSRPERSAPLVIPLPGVGSSRVDLQACKLEYSIVSPK